MNALDQQSVEIRRQSYKCEGRDAERGCPVFEQYFRNLVDCLSNAEAGITPEDGTYDFPDDLVEAYQVVVRFEAEDQHQVQLDLRHAAAREFQNAGFCPQASTRTPEELRGNGQAGTCRWLDQRLAENETRRATPVS